MNSILGLNNEPINLITNHSEYMPDLEVGEGGFNIKKEIYRPYYEITYIIPIYDLELGNKKIIYDEINFIR